MEYNTGIFGKWHLFTSWHIQRKDWWDYSCVYAFYLNERLVYIGQADNFTTRFYIHRIRFENNQWITRWGVFVDFYIKIKYSVRYGEEAMLEKRLIHRLKPRFNKRIYKRLKYRGIFGSFK